MARVTSLMERQTIEEMSKLAQSFSLKAPDFFECEQDINNIYNVAAKRISQACTYLGQTHSFYAEKLSEVHKQAMNARLYTENVFTREQGLCAANKVLKVSSLVLGELDSVEDKNRKKASGFDLEAFFDQFFVG